MPREDRFLDLFAHPSQTLVAGAAGRESLLRGGDGVAEYGRVICEREAEADDIVVAWVSTMPASAAIAGLCYGVGSLLG